MKIRPWKSIDLGQLGAARETLEPLVRLLNPVLQDLTSATSAQLSLADNLAVSLKTIDVTVPDPWVTIQPSAMLNGWAQWTGSDTPAPAYRKTFAGKTEMRGLLLIPSAAPTSIAFQLPAAYRPTAIRTMATTTNASHARVSVNSNGNVSFPVCPADSFVSLECSFDAASTSPLPATCWPQTLAWDFSGPCVGVVALAALPLDPNNKGVPLSGVSVFSGLPSWEQTSQQGKTVIKINDVPGLAPNRSYRISFLCWAG